MTIGLGLLTQFRLLSFQTVPVRSQRTPKITENDAKSTDQTRVLMKLARLTLALRFTYT